MSETMKHEVFRVDIRIIQIVEDIFELLIQVFRHDRSAVGLADHEAIISIPFGAKLFFQVLLQLFQTGQCLYGAGRYINFPDAAVCFRLLQHNACFCSGVKIRKGKENLHFWELCVFLANTVNNAINTDTLFNHINTIPL